jgi:uncharacterized repeat protein (TIGR02543 family)
MNEIRINGELYGIGGIPQAFEIPYDNSASEAVSTNIQDVIDELWKELSLRALRDYEVVYMVDTGVGYKENVQLGSTALLPTSFTPTKEGYTFMGWRRDNTATNEVLTECVVGEESLTLYAVFRKSYTATFISNESSETFNIYEHYNNANVAAATVIAPTGNSLPNWTWRGWSSANATAGNAAVLCENGATITNIRDNVTYYGLYSQSVTASFKSYDKIQEVTGTRYYNMAGNTVNASVTAPTGTTYSGFTWRGWSAAATTTGNAPVTYNNGDTVSNISANTSYYGLYQQTITLSYNGNSNTGGSTAEHTGTRYWNAYGVYVNPTFTLKNNGYTRTNFKFMKWAQGSSTGNQYAAGASVTLSANTTFYVVWTPTKQTGSVALGYLAWGGVKDVTVKFPLVFASVPSVSLSASGYTRCMDQLSVLSRSIASFKFRAEPDGTPGLGADGNIVVSWTAIAS